MLKKLTEIDTKLDNALLELSDHEKRLRALEGVGNKRWETVIASLISIILGAVVGAIVGHFGL